MVNVGILYYTFSEFKYFNNNLSVDRIMPKKNKDTKCDPQNEKKKKTIILRYYY